MMLRSDGPAKRRGWRMLGATVLLAALTGGAAVPSSAGSHVTAAESASDAAGPATGEESGATERADRPARPSAREATAAPAGRTQPVMQSLSAAGPAPGPQGRALSAPEGTTADPAAAGAVEQAARDDDRCPPRESWWAPSLPGAVGPAMDTDPAERYRDHDDDGAEGGRRDDDGNEEDDSGRDHGDGGWDGRSEGGERH